jgi:chromosome segregation ATPase
VSPAALAQELKKQRDALSRKQEELQYHDTSAGDILKDLRTQAAEAASNLERERRRQHDVDLELASLRGRLAHASKEHAQWEHDIRQREQMQTEELMAELRRIRKLHPLAGRQNVSGEHKLLQ